MSTAAYQAGTTPPPQWRHRIRDARERRGLTQTALARASGLERSNLALIETRRREPSVTTLLRLALALGITVDDLIELGGGS
jgi:transcriptional regulator with XRE-family HTH domain